MDRVAKTNLPRRRRVSWPLLTAFVGAAALLACSSDDDVIITPGGDAAADSPDAGSDGAGGEDANTPDAPVQDGAPSDAGTPDTSPADATLDGGAEGSADGSALDGAVEAGDSGATIADGGVTGDGAATYTGLLRVATTDFSTSEVATIDIANTSVVGAASYASGDVVPKISDGRTFVIDRTNDLVDEIDASGSRIHRVLLGDADGGAPKNPHDIALIPGTSVGFVPLYNAGSVAVVDVAHDTVSSTIDLSSFHVSSDGDGSPDVDAAVYVPSTGLVYITLQRIDQSLYPIPCPSWPSLLVGVDPATNAVVDINGAQEGDALELALTNPGDVVLDAANERLLVLASGCDPGEGGSSRARHGIEAVSLTTGTSTILYAPTNDDYLSRLLLLSGSVALVNSFDTSNVERWSLWSPTSPTLGAALDGLPDGVVAETDDTVLGVRKGSGGDGGASGYDVVRYRVSTGATSLVVSDPLAASFSFVNGAAFVR